MNNIKIILSYIYKLLVNSILIFIIITTLFNLLYAMNYCHIIVLNLQKCLLIIRTYFTIIV